MAENTKIQWAHHTFNPWRGCTKVSDGCKNCYAEVNMSVKLHGIKWGPNGTRRVASDAMWKQPLKWNREAAEAGERRRVFCASLADVFESPETMPKEAHEAIEAARFRLFALIAQTPHLDWLLLTKRPEFAREWMRQHGYKAFNDYRLETEQWPAHNIWIGTTVENQEEARIRIPHLLKIPAAVRFLSCEPLLGPIDFVLRWGGQDKRDRTGMLYFGAMPTIGSLGGPNIDWVIVGGESGSKSRECDVRWIESIVKQCKDASVPVFVKQLGAEPFRSDQRPDWGTGFELDLTDRKGGDIDEWPIYLQIREVPEVVR